MTRGNDTQTKVHHKGNDEDFIVLVVSEQIVKDWKADKSVALSQVVGVWDVFVTHKHGTQGIMDTASNAALENEFGTHKKDDVIKMILEKHDAQPSEASGHQGGDRNITMGPSIAHG